jgi:glycosyltransferase involved in cell wall biosynthesis
VIARGIPPEKVTVVPNAVDPDAFVGPSAADPELAARLGLQGKTVIGFFGSFYAYEGLHLLLRALPKLRRYRPNMIVLLGGGGPEEENLRRLVDEMGVRDAVVFTGRIPHEKIQHYYALIDLLVLPRVSMRLTDLVTPLKPLEAMAQQRIVAASNVGGHCELIRHRETGYLFAADDADRVADGVLDALNDRASWPDIQARALRYVRTERSWATSVARYAAVYDRLQGGIPTADGRAGELT